MISPHCGFFLNVNILNNYHGNICFIKYIIALLITWILNGHVSTKQHSRFSKIEKKKKTFIFHHLLIDNMFKMKYVVFHTFMFSCKYLILWKFLLIKKLSAQIFVSICICNSPKLSYMMHLKTYWNNIECYSSPFLFGLLTTYTCVVKSAQLSKLVFIFPTYLTTLCRARFFKIEAIRVQEVQLKLAKWKALRFWARQGRRKRLIFEL